MMRRRQFITLLGGAAAFVPLAARAQQAAAVRRIGVLMGQAESDPLGQKRVAAFRQGLQELGWTEGRNLQVEWRWAAGSEKRIQDYAGELAKLAPDVVVANGTPVIAAMEKATHSIPTIFVIVNDPVEQGFVSNMAHPGGNVTGFSYIDYTVVGKSLEMLKEIAPGVTRVGLMFDPATTPHYDAYLHAFQTDPGKLSLKLARAGVSSDANIEDEIAKLAAEPGGGLIVPPDTFTIAHRQAILQAAALHRLPAMFMLDEFVEDGGLMSYAPDTIDIFRRSASYVDRILKGESPADLPVQAPTRFELVINLKTAKALGLTVPPTMLALADKVIE
jgi:putative ABC transport system substrate-binding protein